MSSPLPLPSRPFPRFSPPFRYGRNPRFLPRVLGPFPRVLGPRFCAPLPQDRPYFAPQTVFRFSPSPKTFSRNRKSRQPFRIWFVNPVFPPQTPPISQTFRNVPLKLSVGAADKPKTTPNQKQTMQTLNTLNTHTSRRLPGGVEVIQTDRYWLATIEVGYGYLNLEAYPHPDTGMPAAMHWSTDGKYGKSIMNHLERRCDETWEQWFAWLDDQWPNHELRWAFELLSEAFPD